MKHRMKKIIFFIALVILYAYICALLNIPNRVILMQGETLQMKTLLGISITKNLTQDSQETISASSPIGNSVGKEPGSYQFEVKLFDKIKVKDISVHVLDEMEVVPVGRAIGMKLYTEGVLVVGKSEISGKTSYEEADIEEGDLITKINHEDVTCKI